MPYTNRTQTPLFSCRRNINFCLIRTLNRQKLHKVQIFGLIVCWFLSLVVPANMMCSQGNATQWISTVWIKVLCKTRNRAWPFPLESVRVHWNLVDRPPDSSGHGFQWKRPCSIRERLMVWGLSNTVDQIPVDTNPHTNGFRCKRGLSNTVNQIPVDTDGFQCKMEKRVVQYCRPHSSGHERILMKKRVVQCCRPDSSGHKWIPIEMKVVQYRWPDSSRHQQIPMGGTHVQSSNQIPVDRTWSPIESNKKKNLGPVPRKPRKLFRPVQP